MSDPKNTAAIVSPASTKFSKLEFKELLRANGYPRRLISKLSDRWDELHENSALDELLEEIHKLRDLINPK